MKNLLTFLLLVITCSAGNIALANNAYQQGLEFQNKVEFPNPSEAQGLINYEADTTHLQKLGDSDLTNQGSSQLQSTDMGKFLRSSQEKTVDAVGEHQINKDNPLIQNALKIEENPLAEIGSSDPEVNEKSVEVTVKKSCIEGIDFDIDVGHELIYECEDEEYLSEWKSKHKTVDISGNTIYHGAHHLGYPIFWKKKREGWHRHLDNQGWRQYLSGYLKIPLDGQLKRLGPIIDFPYGARGVGSGNHWVGVGNIQVFNKYRFGYTYEWRNKLRRFKYNGEYWQIATEGAEKLAESNQCYETSRTCLKSGVKKFFGKYDVSKPCWYERITYHCSSEPKDGCSHLLKQGCILQDSECLERSGNICLRYKRNYACSSQKKELQYSLKGAPIQCMGGDCHKPVIEQNTDFSNVAYLAAVNAASKDCVKSSGSICKNPITVFPGEQGDCKKIIAGCINCCASMKGWGKSLNLSRCSGEEKGLALKKDRGLCHMVGTYCSRRDPVFRKCLEKKTTHCCFNSKLARVFHQQGRAQLGISWGSPETPNCEPLTLDQLTRLDFSKFDMEELFDVLLDKGKSNMQKNFPDMKPGHIPDTQKSQYDTKKDTREGAL